MKYVPDKHQTKEISDKAVCEDLYTLKFVPNQYKTPKTYERAVKRWVFCMPMLVGAVFVKMKCYKKQRS